MKSSIAHSRQRIFFKRLSHWYREYRLFLATVGVLIGAHFVGEVLKDLAYISCDLIKAYWRDELRTVYTSLVTTGRQIWIGVTVNAAIGFVSYCYMVSTLKLDPHFASKRNPRALADGTDQQTWVERLRDVPTKSAQRIVVFSILFLVLLEVAIHSIELTVHGDAGWHLIWVPVFLLVAIGLAPAAHALTFVNIDVEKEPSDVEEEPSEERKFLIIFLSVADKNRFVPIVNGRSVLKHRTFEDDFQDLETYYKGGGERWNWEPCLRGIARHKGVLDRLYIVASTESAIQIGHFCRHIAEYKKNTALKNQDLEVFAVNAAERTPTRIDLAAIDDEPSVMGIDFENYVQIQKAVNTAVHHAGDEAQTVIDITGGQKPNSLVGGIMTLDKKDLRVQYVRTGGTKEVKFYHIVKQPTLGV